MNGSGLNRFRVVAFVVTCLAGVFPLRAVAIAVTYRSQGFNPDTVLDADCDDCDLTVLLDGIGYFAAVVFAYVVLVVAAAVVLHRAGFFRPKVAVS